MMKTLSIDDKKLNDIFEPPRGKTKKTKTFTRNYFTFVINFQ